MVVISCILIIIGTIFTTLAAQEFNRSESCGLTPTFWCYADWECTEAQGATTQAQRFPAKEMIRRTNACWLNEIGESSEGCDDKWPGL